MHWLNENAAAIRALASIAGLLVTGALVWLTYRYVRLTSAIAASNLEQIKHIKETNRIFQQQNAYALKALALNLRVAFGNILNSFPPKHAELAAFDKLTERVITDLESFARQVDHNAIDLASEAAPSLRVIQGMIQKAKGIHKNTGWVPTEQETKNWRIAMETSHRNLQALESICEQVTKT